MTGRTRRPRSVAGRARRRGEQAEPQLPPPDHSAIGSCPPPGWSIDDITPRSWINPPTWYGCSPAWRVALEASVRRQFHGQLRVIERSDVLEYHIALDVHGPQELTDVTVLFAAHPEYPTYGLPPQDYPRVWAELGRPSKHRMPDDSLCLYYPADPPDRRWTSDKGLLDLLDLAVDHLLYESYWRATGGPDGGRWPSDEADHGFAQQDVAS